MTDPWREPIYLDASAVVKLLVDEPDSDALNEALATVQDVIVSDLTLTETASALGRRRREGRLTAVQAARLQRVAEQLVPSGRAVEITPPVHRRAERLLLAAGEPLRTLDALHIALAVDADAATLVTYDRRLAQVAAGQGLFVVPPPTRSP